MKIAVIGSGISGLSAAWLLRDKHQVTLYEAADYLGGHTHTVDVTLDGTSHPVDTGFLVYNDHTYPNLIRLFDHLGIETHETEMSFSVTLPESNLDSAGANLGTLFAQRRNLIRFNYWRMLQEILHFNTRAQNLLARSEQRRVTLGRLLDEQGYSEWFRTWYLLPMAAAIWSSSPAEILGFPASTFLRFCINHRLLQIKGRPQWRSLIGGARRYVEKLAQPLDIRINTPVHRVTREADRVVVASAQTHALYDRVIFATHAPDTLRMLSDADAHERRLLSAFRYQPNTAVLHTDRGFLPTRESLWSAWNYLSLGETEQSVCVSYLLNRLQRLPFTTPLMLTLNPDAQRMPRDPIAVYQYDHPIFNQSAIDAQARLNHIQGRNRVWFCGAWCGYGFHEDGLKSALRIISDFNVEAPWKAVL
jgi:predicted NAD/FAD-binding protein